jgi:hypothetical protein
MIVSGISYMHVDGMHQESHGEAQHQTDPEAMPKGNAWRGRLWISLVVENAAVVVLLGHHP